MKNIPLLAVCGLAMLAGLSHAGISYTNDFQSGVAGPEWSSSLVDTAPLGGQRLLGQFSNESVSLTLAGVQAGDFISLRFDFCAIRSWDGSAGIAGPGPDVFSVAVRGGDQLLSSTFTVGNPLTTHPMSYPMLQGQASHPGRSGAIANDSLGYAWRGGVLDATWRISLNFVAPTSGLTLDFTGTGLQEIDDEAWGIDNVSVQSESVPAPGAAALLTAGTLLLGCRRRGK